MKLLNANLNIERFFDSLERSAECTLIIDYDGTLAPFREDRTEAKPYPGVPSSIDRIMEPNGSRVVVVSGRGVEDIRPLLGFRKPPEIWGCHGWERMMPDESLHVPEIDERHSSGLHGALAWAETKGLASRCEQKTACLAFHWRGLAPATIASVHETVDQAWRKIALRNGLRLREFNGGIELRVPGRDKGTAVETILDETPPGAVTAYLGDNRTDEDAFRALKGKGFSVLVNESFHETTADLWLIPPRELLEFLSRWGSLCGGSNETFQ